MHAWEAIQKTVDYIEENTTQIIKIEELASQAGLSVFYYQRLFKRLVKTSVTDYIKHRRLAQSYLELINTDQRIIDIALKYQFSNHSNYTRAFKEVYGITPDKCNKNKIPLNHFVKPELLINYVTVDEGVPLISDGIVIEITRKRFEKDHFFVGLEQEVAIEELMDAEATGIATIDYLWQELKQRKNQIPNKLKDGNDFGVLYKGNASEGNCMYMAGTEVKENNKVEGFSTFVLPAQEYLVTGLEAENFDELVNTAIYKATDFTARWQREHSLVTTGLFAVELYYPPTDEAAYLEHLITVQDKGESPVVNC